MLALKAFARLVGFALMIALALLGLGLALYCLDRLVSLGAARPDRLLHLPAVRETVGNYLDRLGASGPTAAISLLCGIGAAVAGVLLLVGVFGSGRRRDAVLSRDDEGELAVSSRAVRAMVRALAERADGITGVRRPKVTLHRRRPGGNVSLTVLTSRASSPEEARRAVSTAVEPVTDPLGLRTRIHPRPGESRQRVQ
jgi:hypothetical protein